MPKEINKKENKQRLADVLVIKVFIPSSHRGDGTGTFLSSTSRHANVDVAQTHKESNFLWSILRIMQSTFIF